MPIMNLTRRNFAIAGYTLALSACGAVSFALADEKKAEDS